MKRKEKESLRTLSKTELYKELRDSRSKLASLKTARYTKQPKDVRELKKLRERIAILATVLKEKELYEQTG